MGRESLSPDYPISKRLDGDLETPLGLNRASEEEQMGNAKTTLSAWQKTIIALTVAIGLATVSQAKEGFDRDFEIKTLSSRPDTVSGGDAVVQVTLPRYASARDVVLELNGVDVTSAFVADATGRQLTGLITGMALGKNELTARAKYHHGGQHFEKLQLVNYPSYGPVFSGEHQRPWICETAASGVGAPPAEGPCVAPSRTDWFYRTTTGMFQPLPSMTSPFPADLAQTTTIDGNTVPYIVRVESGTLDENIYRIALLDDPATPLRNPWSPGGKKPGAGWNGKLTVPFGGGCGPGFRSGSNNATSALQNTPLSLGFAVAFGTRNTLGTGCNDLVSAETLMMIKERFIEQFGVPKFTIGSGGSGGSMQQRLIVQNYPGLLDAITPGVSYSDLVSILPDVVDCGLLNRYFDTVANPIEWPASRRAKGEGDPVNAAGTNTTCRSWNGFARTWQTPFNGFSSVVPVDLRYNPETNPSGARGSFWDGIVNAFGKDPETGFARSGYDNVGVQYGLNALNSGHISVDEFLDLNEKVGGFDVDGNFLPARSQVDTNAIRNTYRTGRLISGENQMVPTIDTRNYTDAIIDIHTRVRTFAFMERLVPANRTPENQANSLSPHSTAGTPIPNIAERALRAHNEWLGKISSDDSGRPNAEKVIRTKPARVTDTCWESSGGAHEERFTMNPSATCNQLFPIFSTVRIQAGGAVAGDIMKCQLKPVRLSDYRVALTSAQEARLKSIFPEGVCDFSRPGVQQRPIQDSWLAYPQPGHAVSLGDDGDDRHDQRHGHDRDD